MEWTNVATTVFLAMLCGIGAWVLRTLQRMETKMAVQDEVNKNSAERLNEHDEMHKEVAKSLVKGSRVMANHEIRIGNMEVDISKLQERIRSSGGNKDG